MIHSTTGFLMYSTPFGCLQMPSSPTSSSSNHQPAPESTKQDQIHVRTIPTSYNTFLEHRQKQKSDQIARNSHRDPNSSPPVPFVKEAALARPVHHQPHYEFPYRTCKLVSYSPNDNVGVQHGGAETKLGTSTVEELVLALVPHFPV